MGGSPQLSRSRTHKRRIRSSQTGLDRCTPRLRTMRLQQCPPADNADSAGRQCGPAAERPGWGADHAESISLESMSTAIREKSGGGTTA